MNRAQPSRGFTLIETLLATALLGALLLALNFFVFSMAEIWGRGAERRLFEQHVRAATREVEELFRHASLPPLPADPPVFVREIRLQDGRRESVLSFELPAGSPRLPWPETPLPDVVCSLVAEPGGLVLYWQSRLEEKFADATPRPWVVTPFLRTLTFEYADASGGAWRSQPTLQRDGNGRWSVPARLRLGFVHGEMKAETTVVLPPAPGPLPHF